MLGERLGGRPVHRVAPMTSEKLAREERRIRVEAMLCAERGAAYEVAFHASVAAVVRFAVEQAGMRGMTKAVHQSLKNCLAEFIGVAVRHGEAGVIPHDVAMALRAHAIAELDETTARLGLRGAK